MVKNSFFILHITRFTWELTKFLMKAYINAVLDKIRATVGDVLGTNDGFGDGEPWIKAWDYKKRISSIISI